jgi:hypothetical protein
VYAYSRDNLIKVAVGEDQRCSAHLLEPRDKRDGGASVIFFTGTNAGQDRDVLMRVYRSNGIGEDLDARLGGTAFDGVRDETRGWVREALAEDRPVVITGHSLGGALASRLAEALTLEERNKVRLLTFCPAGTEPEVAAAMPRDRVQMIYHEDGPVVLFSGVHPAGKHFEGQCPSLLGNRRGIQARGAMAKRNPSL